MRNRTDHHLPLAMNRLQLSIGLAALALGTWVYFFCRSPRQVYFIRALGIPSEWLASLPNFTWPAESNLPAFAHVFAFILISASFAARRKSGYALVSFFWLVLDVAIEYGQKYKTVTLALIPDWLSHVPLLNQSKRYFLHGTFDVADLAATVLGAAAAFTVLCFTLSKPQTVQKT